MRERALSLLARVVSMAFPFQRPTCCEIDLGAVAHNLRQLRGLSGPDVAIYVCLKGDANGCGAVEVARRAEAEGVAGLAFGNVDSALACREAGIASPILLYPSCLPEIAPLLEQKRLMPTLSTLADVAAWDDAARGHLSIDLDELAGQWGVSTHDLAPAIGKTLPHRYLG